ncbi:12563_t:CDS:2, partial [Funneliformis caledonium]
MSFYSLWYKQTINGVAPSSSATSSQTDLTVAQVTVCSIKDKLVYNIDIVAANFRNHGRNHSRIHSRQVSSESLSEVSMWDDWIVKYINEDNKKTIMAEDSPMEEW